MTTKFLCSISVALKRKQQCAADSSAWVSWQGRALYGYAMMSRKAKNKKYLELADNIVNFVLGHPRLPEDMIPYRDFGAPGITNTPRDA